MRQQEQRVMIPMSKVWTIMIWWNQTAIREFLVRMFSKQEYITLNEAINTCGGNKVGCLYGNWWLGIDWRDLERDCSHSEEW